MIVEHTRLERFATELLTALRVSEPDAALVAHSLVAANLRAVDSHGLQLLPFYIDQIEHANIDISAHGCVASKSVGCLTYDGQNGIGQVIANHCCDHAIRLGRAYGAGFVVARESNHFGAAAYWAQRISAEGLIALVMCNSSPLVAPWQGKEYRLGTNPLCVSVPGPNTWLLDMATTTVAAGKIFKAHLTNQRTIPPGWAMDAEGVPTTETEVAMHGSLMPLGGYKGSGLAVLAEIFCGVLSGGAMSTQLGGIRIHGKPARVSQCFLAIDVARFMPPGAFEERMRDLVEMLKSSAPARGYDEILVAGEPEWRAEAVRTREGIPVSAATWNALSAIATKYGIAIPT